MPWNYTDISVAHKYMAAVAKLCNCDMRRIANEMHLYYDIMANNFNFLDLAGAVHSLTEDQKVIKFEVGSKYNESILMA